MSPRLVPALAQLAWGVLCVLTLGFIQKYRDRLSNFEVLDPGCFSEDYSPYSDPPSYYGCPDRRWARTPGPNPQDSGPTWMKFPEMPDKASSEIPYGPGGSLRSRQGDEWSKLSTALSVITATGAAALAIPDQFGPGAYWAANASFCSALGVSIEGLILIFYIQVMAAGASDETIGRLARGKVGLVGIEMPPWLPALIMGLPVVFATYSSLFLLIGTVAMVVTSTWGPSKSFPEPCHFLPLIPIGFGFLCMCGAVVVCEAGASQERKIRKKNAEVWDDRPRSPGNIVARVDAAADMSALQKSLPAHEALARNVASLKFFLNSQNEILTQLNLQQV